MSELNGNSNGNGSGDASRVTYAEVRRMAHWLNAFTARDLAAALHVHEAIGERFVRALLWSGHVAGPVIQDTGAWIDGPDGEPEPIYEVRAIPVVHVKRYRYTPPEIQAVIEMFGGFILYDPRGQPVRIRTERQMRRSLSTPGARQVHKNRERAYERQEEAKRQRAERDRRKRIAESQGKRLSDD